MTAGRRAKLLGDAQRLAEERATLWRVWKEKGAQWPPWRVVEASSEHRALKAVRRSTVAVPLLTTTDWMSIYEEVGLGA